MIGFEHSTTNLSKATPFRGNSSYLAPELLNKPTAHGPKTDVYAAGVVLYALLCGQMPFRGDNDE